MYHIKCCAGPLTPIAATILINLHGNKWRPTKYLGREGDGFINSRESLLRSQHPKTFQV